ncbi:MAG: single-stranded DNA-binding protein [Elusimicrobiota bacterium]
MATGVRLPELNLVVLSGRVTRDGEIFVTQSGLSKLTVSLAVNRRVKDAKTGEWKDDVFFIDCVAWRELADRSKEKAKKGASVVVEGRLTCREYEDKAGGAKRKAFEVMANRLQFLTMSASASAGAGTDSQKSSAPADADSIEEVPF